MVGWPFGWLCLIVSPADWLVDWLASWLAGAWLGLLGLLIYARPLQHQVDPGSMSAKTFTILAANWTYHFGMGVYASTVSKTLRQCRRPFLRKGISRVFTTMTFCVSWEIEIQQRPRQDQTHSPRRVNDILKVSRLAINATPPNPVIQDTADAVLVSVSSLSLLSR